MRVLNDILLQTPEWKRAYMCVPALRAQIFFACADWSPPLTLFSIRFSFSDYRCLKKCIGAIRADHIARQNSTGTTDVDQVHKQAREYEEHIGMLVIPNTFSPTYFASTYYLELSLFPRPDAPTEVVSTVAATQIQRRNSWIREQFQYRLLSSF